MSHIINVIAVALFLFCWIMIVRKLIITRYGPVKTVKAEVADKYISHAVSKYPRTFMGDRYIVVFATKNKRLSFNVSEFSYNNYKIREKGTLKYKGDKLISFK